MLCVIYTGQFAIGEPMPLFGKSTEIARRPLRARARARKRGTKHTEILRRETISSQPINSLYRQLPDRAGMLLTVSLMQKIRFNLFTLTMHGHADPNFTQSRAFATLPARRSRGKRA